MVYQPIAHNPEGSIAGVEALLRWTHPQRGPIAATTIIRVAEQSGMIAEVGAWVLARSCRDHAQWLADNPTVSLDLAVNVSARQLLDRDFPKLVTSVLEQTDTNPPSLILEVTESVFIEDDGAARRILTELDDLGIRLAHDLDLDLVAEGIETQDQADQVNALGCQYAQGLLFAKPMPALAISARLARQPNNR